MLDGYKREITYLRISVTDLCNLRCCYCMPEEGIEKLSHEKVITIEEIENITKAAAQLGISKIRLTGGEPLVRKGIIDICKRISAIPGIEELCITTNGILLSKYAQQLKDAGVNRINLSLDTLKEEKYRQITRVGNLSDVLDGFKKCLETGFDGIKLNIVLIKGFNDDEIVDFVELTRDLDIQVRFIELMPIGEAILWEDNGFISNEIVLEKCPDLKPIGIKGVANSYQIDGYKGTIGLISPVSSHICSQCNRIRVTADGHLKACLNSKDEIDIKNKSYEEVLDCFNMAINNKPKDFEFAKRGASNSERYMSQIGG